MRPIEFQNIYVGDGYRLERGKEGEGQGVGQEKANERQWLPLWQLNNTVLFPNILMPVYLKNEKTVHFIKRAYKKKQLLALLLPKKPNQPQQLTDFHTIGTAVTIERVITLPHGESVAIVQGRKRFRALDMETENHVSRLYIEFVKEPAPSNSDNSEKIKALVESVKEATKKILSNFSDTPKELYESLNLIKDPVSLFYYIASNTTDISCKQQVLESHTTRKKGELLLSSLMRGLQFTKFKKELQDKFLHDIGQEQKAYLIRQQIRVLQNELGELDDIEALRAKAQQKKWPQEVQEYFDKTLQQMNRMPTHGSEYSTYLNQLNLLLELPWDIHTPDNEDLKYAAQVLDKNHFGMAKVKERLLEFLAVHTLKKKQKGFILCLLGPPGVGKTTIAASIAEALRRKFEKISLGALHDEATLRGHRKTYVAAMEGKIINSIKRAGSANPVILLDEIDKIDTSRGYFDAVLMEVLDPSQNQTFKDNYLDVPFDLSNVLFIATANNQQQIPRALADRMEFIELSGYAVEEKLAIAKKHIIPQQLEANGVRATEVTLNPAALTYLIEAYTSEAGVRELTRKITAIARKIAKKILENAPYPKKLTPTDVTDLLGVQEFDPEHHEKIGQPGVALGLAWTETGGCILFIEALLFKGEGKITLSGQLGEVMEESALAAHSYLKAHAEQLNIDARLFKNYDLHIHLTPGAVTKDGPSAGIALFTALASLYTQRKVKDRLAMTGELAFRNMILPVGGIKEKILAAKRAGIKEIILSVKNKKNVEEIPAQYRKNLVFHYLDHVDQVVPIALHKQKVKNAQRWTFPRQTETPAKRTTATAIKKLTPKKPPIHPPATQA